MQRLLALMIALAASVSMADEKRIETINVSTSSATAAATLTPGREYVIQCTLEVRYRTCASAPCTAVTTDLQIPTTAPNFSGFIPRVGMTKLALLAGTTGTCELYSSEPRTTQTFRSEGVGGLP